MSADNYHLVRQIDGRWHVWLSLSMSGDREAQVAGRRVDRIFDDKADAYLWASEQGYAEYGTEIDAAPAAGELVEDLQALLLGADLEDRYGQVAVPRTAIEQAVTQVQALRAFAQDCLTHYQIIATSGEGCASRELEDRARALGLNVDAWLTA